MTLKINYGEIWLADLTPQSGTQPGKLRPVLIVQNQVLLDIFHTSTIIIPLTTNLIDHAEPLRIRINTLSQLEKDSDLLIDQIRSIDNKRLVKGPLAQCSLQSMVEVQDAIREVLGIDQEKQVALN